MTREEEIKDFAIKRFGNEGNESQFMLYKIQACIVGAKWADTTMLNKACSWIKDNLCDSYDRDGRPTIDSPSCTSVDEFIEEFCKELNQNV